MLKLGGRGRRRSSWQAQTPRRRPRPAGSLPGPDFTKRIPLSEVPEFPDPEQTPLIAAGARVAQRWIAIKLHHEDRDRSAGRNFYLRYADPGEGRPEEPTSS